MKFYLIKCLFLSITSIQSGIRTIKIKQLKLWTVSHYIMYVTDIDPSRPIACREVWKIFRNIRHILSKIIIFTKIRTFRKAAIEFAHHYLKQGTLLQTRICSDMCPRSSTEAPRRVGPAMRCKPLAQVVQAVEFRYTGGSINVNP
jgi:hypothetical protein